MGLYYSTPQEEVVSEQLPSEQLVASEQSPTEQSGASEQSTPIAVICVDEDIEAYCEWKRDEILAIIEMMKKEIQMEELGPEYSLYWSEKKNSLGNFELLDDNNYLVYQANLTSYPKNFIFSYESCKRSIRVYRIEKATIPPQN